MFTKSSSKGVEGSLMHSDYGCVSLGGSGSLATSLTAANTLTTRVSQPSLSVTSGFSFSCSFLSGPGLADDVSSVSISSLVTRLLSSTGGSLLGIIGTVFCFLSLSFVSGRLAVEVWRTWTVLFPSVLIRARFFCC